MEFIVNNKAVSTERWDTSYILRNRLEIIQSNQLDEDGRSERNKNRSERKITRTKKYPYLSHTLSKKFPVHWI